MRRLALKAAVDQRLTTTQPSTLRVARSLVDLLMKSFTLTEDTELCNDLMIGIVMKMGDKHLRIIVKRLESLRKADDEKAFWSATARLNRELKSIFLPCYKVEPVMEILSAFKGGKKRGRVEEDDVIETVLEGLDHALRADGHNEGAWCQAEDNRRYKLLLEELGRLLLEGGDEVGGAAGKCLVSLASAGSSDLMWKPLNFALLEACGFEEDAAVRKRGVKCLKEILETLGEEYSSLIPECVPVFAELLEEDDGEIRTLARECVRVCEEVTGEDFKEYLA